MKSNLQIIKKDGTKEPFTDDKIINALRAADTEHELTHGDIKIIMTAIKDRIPDTVDELTVDSIHDTVLYVLPTCHKNVSAHCFKIASKYREYRNFRQKQTNLMTETMAKLDNVKHLDHKRCESVIAKKRAHITKHHTKPVPEVLITAAIVEDLIHDEAYDVLKYYVLSQ